VILKTVVIVMAKRFTWADDRLQLEAEMDRVRIFDPLPDQMAFDPVTRPDPVVEHCETSPRQ